MPIDLTCSCGKQLQVADKFAGRQGRCPVCGELLEIPERDAVTGGANPSPLEAAQTVTATPGWAESAEPGPPEDAVTALPPESEEWLFTRADGSRPEYKLFSPGSIGLVAFLAGPVGAFLLLTLNYWRLRKRVAAGITIACCLLTMGVMLAVSLALPNSLPSLLIGVPLFVILWAAAHALQGRAYEAYRRQRGKPASGWSAAGVALLGIVLNVGFFLTYDFYLDTRFGPKIEYAGREEVYYTKGATEANARAIGEFLREEGFFDGRSPKAVRVSLDGTKPVISFIVQNWVLNDLQAQEELRTLGQRALQQAFGDRPVVVELCDEYFNVKKRL